jgi:checkpoint serine/threonine-protein kinase
MGSNDIVNFDVIQNEIENIQQLPSGRSAKALAQLYTPPLSSRSGQILSPSQLQDSNNEARQKFEKELRAIDDSDDPLDVYDRYVKWTLDAYPSAQNTPQSQLCPLLERATKAFQSSTHYKNDPRYLKLWLHYIRLFSDAPRETFAYLARHNIGDGLALFYEEFAAWLETAGRWRQAEEVYALGIEREARPAERLIRKYGEFQHRFENRPQDIPEPKSPALPTVRPALAAKIDPFAHASPGSVDPQAQSRARMGGGSSKPGKAKLAIFSDGDEPAKPGSSGSMQGWDSIGSLADRKKENTTEARSWVGETLKVGKKNTGVQKMMIFKDEVSPTPCIGPPSHIYDHRTNGLALALHVFQTESNSQTKPHPMREYQQAVNPKTGRLEVVFTDLRLVYPNHEDPMADEYSFEELRALHRGWSKRDWRAEKRAEHDEANARAKAEAIENQSKPKSTPFAPKELSGQTSKPQTVPLKDIDENAENDENMPPSQAEVEKAKAARKARREERANRTRKIKVMEVREIRGETQTSM